MAKLFIIVLAVVFILLCLIQLINWLSKNKKKYPSGSTLDELSAKASKNYEEREALREEVKSSEEVLQDIRTKTS